jgi:hypothetical protein
MRASLTSSKSTLYTILRRAFPSLTTPQTSSQIRPVQPTNLQGIVSGLSVKGIGTARYLFESSDGSQVLVSLPNTL